VLGYVLTTEGSDAYILADGRRIEALPSSVLKRTVRCGMSSKSFLAVCSSEGYD
jgi:hypothetical protein